MTKGKPTLHAGRYEIQFDSMHPGLRERGYNKSVRWIIFDHKKSKEVFESEEHADCKEWIAHRIRIMGKDA